MERPSVGLEIQGVLVCKCVSNNYKGAVKGWFCNNFTMTYELHWYSFKEFSNT